MSKHIHSIDLIRDFVPFKQGTRYEFKDGINCFVGDQGCGKSTLMYLLMEHFHKTAVATNIPQKKSVLDDTGISSHYQTPTVEYIENQEFKDIMKVSGTPFVGEFIFFDMERHNPRTMNDEIGRTDISAIRRFIEYTIQQTRDGDLQNTLSVYVKQYAAENNPNPTDDIVISRFKSHGQVLFPMLEQACQAKNGLVFLDEPETSLSPRSLYKMVNMLKKAAANGTQIFIATHSELLMKAVGEILSLEHGKWMNSYEFLETQKLETVAG